jgi:hypothetical protein
MQIKMSRHINKLLATSLGILILLFSTSCTERIDIDTGSTYTRLAVEGYITPQYDKQWVRLTKSSDYFSNVSPEGVSGAQVIVDDGSSLATFIEDTENPGMYIAPDGYIGIPNTEYRLDIELTEIINESKSYTAIEKMPYPGQEVDSIALEYDDFFEVWLVKLYAQEPPTEDYYMFNGYVNGKIVTDSVESKNISDDKLFNGNYTSGAVVMVIREALLKEGDLFTMELSNITKEYADYMIQLQLEIRPQDPLFSGPPANVTSNLDYGAVGYFSCYSSVFASTVAKINPK